MGFTRTAAKELARFGVTVNAISPNADTHMIASMPDEKHEEFSALIPLGDAVDQLGSERMRIEALMTACQIAGVGGSGVRSSTRSSVAPEPSPERRAGRRHD